MSTVRFIPLSVVRKAVEGDRTVLELQWPVGSLVTLHMLTADLEQATGGGRVWLGYRGGHVVACTGPSGKGWREIARFIVSPEKVAIHWKVHYRDGNPFNLIHTNIGIFTRKGRRSYWLELMEDDVDWAYSARWRELKWPSIPPAILNHRKLRLGVSPQEFHGLSWTMMTRFPKPSGENL